MDLLRHFQMLARYNRLANERLYDVCAQLSDDEYRRQRRGSFGSIHALLNHLLVGDRIWMARFEGRSQTALPLNTVLYDEFAALREARMKEDERIESFFRDATPELLSNTLRYVNSKGKDRNDEAAMAVAHFFNHQTHHRGQVHVMLSQTAAPAPPLDLHWLIAP